MGQQALLAPTCNLQAPSSYNGWGSLSLVQASSPQYELYWMSLKLFHQDPTCSSAPASGLFGFCFRLLHGFVSQPHPARLTCFSLLFCFQGLSLWRGGRNKISLVAKAFLAAISSGLDLVQNANLCSTIATTSKIKQQRCRYWEESSDNKKCTCSLQYFKAHLESWRVPPQAFFIMIKQRQSE